MFIENYFKQFKQYQWEFNQELTQVILAITNWTNHMLCISNVCISCFSPIHAHLFVNSQQSPTFSVFTKERNYSQQITDLVGLQRSPLVLEFVNSSWCFVALQNRNFMKLELQEKDNLWHKHGEFYLWKEKCRFPPNHLLIKNHPSGRSLYELISPTSFPSELAILESRGAQPFHTNVKHWIWLSIAMPSIG